MAEFDITDWTDFVRGIADPGDEARMRRHLASGSSAPARRMVETLRWVAGVGRSDHQSLVPAYAVRIAKAIASQGRSAETGQTVSRHQTVSRPQTLLRRLCCTLAFDSRMQPAPAGTRDLEGSHRRVIYIADDYRIQVRLEGEPRSSVAVGQVTSRGEAGRPMPRVPVLVFSGRDMIDQAVTSRYGEFQFEGLPHESLELCLAVGEDFLEVPLDLGAGEEAGL